MIDLSYYDDQIKHRRELLKMKMSQALRYQLYKEINSLTVSRLKAIDQQIIKSVQEAKI
jgi:hypothetical protein